MARRVPVKRLLKALAAVEDAMDPIDGVVASRRLREVAEDLERAKVEEARRAGHTWREIGVLYDISKQAAQQRFGAHGRHR